MEHTVMFLVGPFDCEQVYVQEDSPNAVPAVEHACFFRPDVLPVGLRPRHRDR